MSELELHREAMRKWNERRAAAEKAALERLYVLRALFHKTPTINEQTDR